MENVDKFVDSLRINHWSRKNINMLIWLFYFHVLNQYICVYSQLPPPHTTLVLYFTFTKADYLKENIYLIIKRILITLMIRTHYHLNLTFLLFFL